MARTSNIFARVEPEIKEQAEKIFKQLGIPMSNVHPILGRIDYRYNLGSLAPAGFSDLRYSS